MDTLHDAVCMYAYDKILLNSSEKEKHFRHQWGENENGTLCSITFVPESVTFIRWCRKILQPGRPRSQYYIAYALCMLGN
jgi:hypothetical protein